jgi:hypothetical protein
MQMRMATWSRRLALAALLNVTVGAATGAAQTVFIRNGPPGFNVEAVVNSTVTGTGIVETSGIVTVPVDIQKNAGGKTEIDAYLFVDVCDKLRRVIIAERGVQPIVPAAGCERKEIPGLYLIRRISTIVIDLGGPSPTVLLRQGRYRVRPPRVWKPAPTGLVVYGGGTFTTMRDAGFVLCGAVEGCERHDKGFGYMVGATFWLTKWLGADVSYIKPRSVTGKGSGSNYSFDSAFDPELVTVGAKVGVPAGPIRVFGQTSMNYHRATTTTLETIGSAQQTLEYKTKGWSWGFGGGLEAWITGRFALFGEAGTAKVKGKDVEKDGEAAIDDRLTFVFFGARLRIGG